MIYRKLVTGPWASYSCTRVLRDVCTLYILSTGKWVGGVGKRRQRRTMWTGRSAILFAVYLSLRSRMLVDLTLLLSFSLWLLIHLYFSHIYIARKNPGERGTFDPWHEGWKNILKISLDFPSHVYSRESNQERSLILFRIHNALFFPRPNVIPNNSLILQEWKNF